MIRALIMIAVAGLLVSSVTLSLAAAIAGPDALAIAHGAAPWPPGGWAYGWNFHRGAWGYDQGPQTTREIAWSGGQTLDVDLPADVQYTQTAGPAKLTVSGPQSAVADVEVEDGHIRYRQNRYHNAELTIVMAAPSITRFAIRGSGKLAIADYRQDSLELDLMGSGEVTAAGVAGSVQLNTFGSVDADLGAVQTRAAVVNIRGSGDAILAPTDSADVSIAGSGDVTLLTRPPKLQTNISGSGRLREKDRDTAPGASAAPPAVGA